MARSLVLFEEKTCQTPPNNPSQDFGSNLWVAVTGMANNTLLLLETNTISDVLYELQGCTNLASPNWTSFGFVTGSELTNCTPAITPANNGDMFFRVRSWQGVDGIPFWWFLMYLGQDTNVSGEMFSPSGDGWTLLQCWEDGINPTNWVTPPAPQGLTITSFDSTNNTATLSWMLSAGPVQGYVVQTPNGTNDVGPAVSSYTDNSSSSSAAYSIAAIYPGGLSGWSASVSVADFEYQSTNTSPATANNTLSASIIAGPLGTAYLAVSAMPTNTMELEVSRIDQVATEIFGDESYNTNFYISVANATNGFYPIANILTPPDIYIQEGEFSGSEENWLVQAIETNGMSASTVDLGYGFTTSEDPTDSWTVAPYFDGRTQMMQNVAFQLRSAQVDTPFKFAGAYAGYPVSVAFATNYL
ncbi:MAG: hypothetical protein ACREFR_08565 [Limisphaerales bacterium]